MNVRIVAVAGGLAVLLLLVAARIVHLTLANSPELAQRARRQHHERIQIAAHRGAIVDRHGETLAASIERPSIYVRPRRVTERARAAATLPAALGLSRAAVEAKLASSAPFVWLKRTVTPRESVAVETLALAGVGALPEARRVYPHGTTAAHVLGFAGVDLQGLEGVELAYERDLGARPGTLEIERDARGRAIFTGGGAAAALGASGATVQLTLDTALQSVAERALEQAVRDTRALAGSVVVLDPWSGAILALANVPTFDPNDRAGTAPAHRRNRVLTDFYEPGSTFKALLAAAALEHGVVHPDELVFCENGRFRVGRWTINDHHKYGWLTVAEVLKVSSNIGMAKIGERLGAPRFRDFLERFDLGRPTGVDLPGEVGGLLPKSGWSRITLTTVAFGQGVAVTPLQIARAFAAIANGGLLVTPYVAARALHADGTLLWERTPEPGRRVMTTETARAVTAMLEGVLEEGGTGTKARVEGLRVAGKTGTAQKVEPGTGQYSPRGRIASFIGFLPAEEPRAVIVALLDEPQTATYGGIVAAPVFRTVAAAAMERLGVDAPPLPERPLEAAAAAVARRPAASAAGVPSFLGLSMRAALERARALGWMVEVDGSGYVASQTPPPGATAAPGKALVLRLSPSEPL